MFVPIFINENNREKKKKKIGLGFNECQKAFKPI